MWRISLVLTALSCAACGDNAAICGPGTVDQDGTCIPDNTSACGPGTKLDSDGLTCIPDGTIVCSGGTRLDTGTGHCVIDPAACQDGTVLVGGECVDPAQGLAIDVEEQAEPNGLGLDGEPSINAAGAFFVPAIGAAPIVIHGTVAAADHDGDGAADPDIDAFTFSASGPTLLDLSVDGLHGAIGGLHVVARDGQPVAGSFARYGLALAGDTAHRRVFLPAAGNYVLGIADTRSLLDGVPVGAAAGAPALEYFVSIAQLALPAPTPLTVVGALASTPPNTALAPGDVAFYTAPVGDGLDEALATFARASVQPAIAVLDDGALRARADAPAGSAAADVTFGGVLAGDTVTFVVDHVVDAALDSVPYSLLVQSSSGVALSATGGQVAAPKHATSPTGPAQFDNFYFDVAHDGDTLGMQLAFDAPVDVAVLDGSGAVAAPLTWLSGQPEHHTTSGYTGNLRFAKAGRYYLSAYDPASGTGTLKVTSTYATLAAPDVALGTPLATTIPAAYSAGPLAYTATRATAPWQELAIAGADLELHDPAAAFGRLDPLVVDGAAVPGDPVPLAAAHARIDRILLDDPSDTYYVHVRASGAITADFHVRPDFHDFGAVTPGTAVPVATDGPPTLYLVRATPGARLTLTATQTGAAIPAMQQLAADESATGFHAAGTLVAPASAALLAPPSGWVAWQTTGAPALPIAQGVTVAPPQTYAVTAGSTAYADACGGGSVVQLTSANDGVSTAAIAVPAGFRLFDRPVAQLYVMADGYLALAPRDAHDNVALPARDGIDGTIAPYWDDLYNIQVCRKTIGSKLVVQWTGNVCGPRTNSACNGATQVQFQAILDGATSTIELVYGSAQSAQASGDSATIGIEDPQSTAATLLGFDQSPIVGPNTSKLLTPQT